MAICCACLLPLLLDGSFDVPHSKVTQNEPPFTTAEV
jgi:hypothetical protein